MCVKVLLHIFGFGRGSTQRTTAATGTPNLMERARWQKIWLVGWSPNLVSRRLYTFSPASFFLVTVEAVKASVLLPVAAGELFCCQ
jgi:hypothetical protein